jgi:hypothetical protein
LLRHRDSILVMDESPEGHWPKIIRAEEHLAAARAEFDFYREGDVYRVIGEFDPNGLEFVLRTELRYPPSPRFAILIGEFFNCLRSALDHLAFRMVRKHSPTRLSNPKSIWFPINETRLDRDGNEQPLSSLLKGVAGIAEVTLTLIEQNQPYNRGEDASWHPLAIVQNLNNIDKHRTLVLTSSMAAQGGAFGFKCGGQIVRGTYLTGIFKPGAEVARFEFTPAEAEAYGCVSIEAMEMYGYAPIEPTFNEPEPPLDRPVYDVVEECLLFVRRLISMIASSAGLV